MTYRNYISHLELVSRIINNCLMNKKYLILILCFITTISFGQNANDTYNINIGSYTPTIKQGHLQIGSNISPNGDTLDISSYYFTKNGHPWYPVMGEMHYSRLPKSQWEASILKMKATGITVIASYIIWIYHEEEQGVFDFSGQRDLKTFIQLCKKHGMFVHLRLGPWIHGEVRNGGFPDWLQQKGRKALRNNSTKYLVAVENFWKQISKQVDGLFFKNGGPIIGIQLENEYRFNKPEGLEHMLTLKKMAINLGFDVPFYTATGWPGSDLSQTELIPVWGQYPAAPWTRNTSKLKLIDGYLMGPLKNDPNIGTDLLGSNDKTKVSSSYQYPYATAEMGGGNQVTYHRRPIIKTKDLMGIHYSIIGSGANLMGYYMFHGGSNLIGKNSTLQESKATGYPNDCPIISYDFQSPIGEYGQISSSYNEFKILHSFLNNFGHLLCTYTPSFPDKKPVKAGDNSLLRMAVRSNNKSGFIFINNYQRHLKMKTFENVFISLESDDNKQVNIPKSALRVEANTQMILPFNMNLDGVNLNYATIQPLCKLNDSINTFVFFVPKGVDAEISLHKNKIEKITAPCAVVDETQDSYLFHNIKTGVNGLIKINQINGKKVNLLILSKDQALNSWQTKLNGKEQLIISSDQLYFPDTSLVFNSKDNLIEALIYPKLSGLKFNGSTKTQEFKDGIFTHYKTTLKACKTQKIKFEQIPFEAIQQNTHELPEDDRLTNTSLNNPGPQYQTNISAVEGAKYWKIKVPKIKHPFVNEGILSLDYTGDTGATYLNGNLIADNFFQGIPAIIGLSNFGLKSTSNEFIFQLIPLTKDREIYFEDGIFNKIINSKQQLDKIDLQLQYNIILN